MASKKTSATDFEKHTREFYEKYFFQWKYFGDEQSSFSNFDPAMHGPFGKPLARARVGKRHEEKILFEAGYSFDAFGRRVSPPTGSGEKTEFAIFAGGTQIFGEGVNDEETLPSCFQRLSPALRAYNYGYLGLGPQNFLHKLQKGFGEGEITEADGQVFCFYRDDCVPLVRGKCSWARNYPWYEPAAGGKLELRGSFDAAGAPPAPQVYLPSDYREEDYEITARVYAEIRDRVRELFPKGRFLVVIEPVTFTAARIIEHLKCHGVEWLDLACVDLDYLAWPHSRTFDTNLTPGGNQVIAGLLKTAIVDPEYPELLSKRRKALERLVSGEKDPSLAAFHGGFLFNYYDIFPMDDALDLALRCSMNVKAPDLEALQHQLLARVQAGFQLKKDLLHRLRDSGYLDSNLRPLKNPTRKEIGGELKALTREEIADELIGIFHDSYFADYDRSKGST